MSAEEQKLRTYLEKLTTALRHSKARQQKLEGELERHHEQLREPIALVGMACRFPGGIDSPERMWEALDAGFDATTSFPEDRGWDLDALYDADPDHAGTTITERGGFLHDAALFDPLFFGISPREAETIDPQQRVLLELSWEALERARIVPSALQGSNTGAYVGIIYQDYGGRFIATPEALNGNVWIGSSGSVSSGRLSYTLGLEGPAVSVDTACSSSLVAIHLACNALRRGECDLALAGGATIMAAPIMLIEFSRQRGLAPDGRSKAFSSAADGVGWGEGAGMVVLERLSDALAKGHPVLATIRGSAVNQDGRSQGLTAPNGPAQQRVIRAALERAGLEPDAIDLIDAHGTGTRLGDPIEAIALQRVFGKTRPPERPLYIGSLKSNTGHSQAAAGVGSLIKAVVAMQHGRMPKTLHAEDQSGEVDWEGGGVDVLAKARPWSTAAGAPRRAGVSSFGISGTNAHLVVEEHASSAAAPAGARADAGSFPVLLSARSKAALRGQASRLAEHLRAHPELPVPAVAQALLHTRSHFEQRAGVLASADDRASVLAGLDALAAKTPHPLTVEGSALRGGKLVFVFPGQGAQWLGMGRALLEQSKVFADTVAACAAALKPHLDWDLYSILRGDEGAPSLQREDVIQPALWTMMIALVRVWAELGVEPDAVVGHSQGEIAAACVIGALSLEDGAQIVARRSKVLSTIAGSSGMGLTSLSKAELEPLLEPYGDRLSLAVDSGPASTVVAGEVAAVDELLATLDARGVFARRVKIDYASHTRYVEPIRPQVLESLAGLRPRRGRVPMLSTVTTDFVTGEELDAEYWYANLRNPVRFAEATRALIAAGHDHFVEVSPHPVMSVAVNATLENEGRRGAVVGSLRRQQGALEQVLLGAMGLHCAGRPVDWSALPPLAKPNTVAALPELPTYAFDRQRYWIDPPRSQARAQPQANPQRARVGASSIAAPAGGDHPILAETAPLSGTTGVRVWEGQLDGERLPWVHDHQVGGATLFPGAGTMELLLGVGQALGPSAVELRDLELLEPLVLGEDAARLQVVTQESGPNEWRATLSVADSSGDAGWTALARATLHRANPDAAAPGSLDALRGRLEVQRVEDLYDRLRAAGLEYGSAFQGLRELALAPADDGVLEGLARVRLDTELPALAPAARTGFAIHPAALDAAFHLAAAAILDQHPDQGTFVPTAMERLEWYAGDDDRPLAADPSGDLWVHARLRRGAERGRFLADFELWAADGQRLGRLTGLALDSLDPRAAASTQPSSLLQLRWQTHPEPAPAAAPLGRWLVLGGGPSTEAIASALRERGATVEVHAPSALATPLVRAFVEGAEAAKERAGVLVLAALELPSFDEASADPSYPRARAAEPAWSSTLAAVRELAA
ncbi:modular polyketide synthase, partial [Plesiocystis pacifica SIR-1]